MKKFLVMSLASSLIWSSFPAVSRAGTGGLEEESLFADIPTVVTATLKSQKATDAPASVTVVTADEIKTKGYRFLKDIMVDVPGFEDVSDANEEIVAVRGTFASTTNTFLILVNGHRMNDLKLGRYNVDQFIGLDAVDRVEFIRGASSALYGTGALVGVVNVITKKGGDVEGTQLRARTGPFANEGSMTWGRDLGQGRQALFNFTYLDAKGEKTPQPAAVNVVPAGQPQDPGVAYTRKYPRNWSGFMSAESGDLRMDARMEHNARAIPRTPNGSLYVYGLEPFKPLYTENNAYIDITRQLTLGDKSKLTINPSFHYYHLQEYTFTPNNTGATGFGANWFPPYGNRTGQQTQMQQSELKLTYEDQLAEKLNLIAGFDGILADFYQADGIVISSAAFNVVPNGSTRTGPWSLGGYFLQAIWSPTDPLSVTVGGRYDTYAGRAKSQATPRVGVVYKLTQAMTAKLLYGTSYLAPMWDHTNSGSSAFVGNPNLQPEKFNGSDAIFTYTGQSLRAEADLFYTHVSQLITSVGANYANQGRNTYQGAEVSAKYAIRRSLSLNGSYSYVDPVLGETKTTASLVRGRHIIGVPRHTVRYGVEVNPLEGLTASLWGRTYSVVRTADPVTGSTSISGVSVLDASVRYAWKSMEVQLIGNNIADKSYEVAGGGNIKRPLPREGRSVDVEVGYKFK